MWCLWKAETTDLLWDFVSVHPKLDFISLMAFVMVHRFSQAVAWQGTLWLVIHFVTARPSPFDQHFSPSKSRQRLVTLPQIQSNPFYKPILQSYTRNQEFHCTHARGDAHRANRLCVIPLLPWLNQVVHADAKQLPGISQPFPSRPLAHFSP